MRGLTKYRNKPVKAGDRPDGLRFASQAEARRYDALRVMERIGDIANLKSQPRFPLIVNGQTVCTYVGDFSYRKSSPVVDGMYAALLHREIVEDVKGCETPVFKIKAKLFRALHPSIELRLIYSGKRSKRMSEEQLQAIESRRAASLIGT